MANTPESKPSKRVVVVGGKEYPEITPEEEKIAFEQMDKDDKERQKLSLALYARITERANERIPVRLGKDLIAVIRRLTDGEFNDILIRNLDAATAQTKSYTEMTPDERAKTDVFNEELVAAAIVIPEQLKDPAELRKLDKMTRLVLQFTVSGALGLGVTQKKFEDLLSPS